MKVLIITILLFSPLIYFTNAQWEAGISYSMKNEFPRKGFSVYGSRNLPFQWPLAGFEINADVSFFREEITNITIKHKGSSGDFSVKLSGVFYPFIIQPYAGPGIGLGYFRYANKSEETDNLVELPSPEDKLLFHFIGTAGIRILLFDILYPFAELQYLLYINSPDDVLIHKDIMEGQLRYKIGAGIKLDF